MKIASGTLLQRLLPLSVRRRIHRSTRWPPIKWVRLGGMRRLKPVCRDWGFSRGLPIDRYYIEQFLSTHADDIRGRVLEIKANDYTLRFGGSRVTKSDVLHVEAGNPKTTIVADLTSADDIPSDTFDCIICTQTLQFIYRVEPAIRTLYRILKPGSALLVTTPGISQISRYDMDRWGDYWRFTSLSARLLFEEVFPKSQVTVKTHGNVLAAITFLHGLAAEELKQKELDFVDSDYEQLITIRAVKPEKTE